MKVVDASIVVGAVIGLPAARAALEDEDLFAPPHVDLEVLQSLRRFVLAGQMTERVADQARLILRELGLTRYPVHGLGDRIWELRDNLSVYDAAYVAVAESLECGLLTGDRGMARAPGVRCSITWLSTALS